MSIGNRPASLTGREAEVLRSGAAGLTDKAIAALMGVADGTIAGHWARILKKLNAANRAEAVDLWKQSAGDATESREDEDRGRTPQPQRAAVDLDQVGRQYLRRTKPGLLQLAPPQTASGGGSIYSRDFKGKAIGGEHALLDLYQDAGVPSFRMQVDGPRVIDANGMFLEMAGLAPIDLAQWTPSSLWADPRRFDSLLESLRTSGRVNDVKCELVNARGERRACLLFCRLCGERGVVEGSFVDMTEQARNANELRRLWQAVACSPAAVLITDLAGTIEYVNPKFTEVTG